MFSGINVSSAEDVHTLLTGIQAQEQPVKYMRIYWNDLSAIPRARVFPVDRILNVLRSGCEFSIGITKGWTGLLPNDSFIGESAAGEYALFPDWNSLRLGPRAGHASVQGEFRDAEGRPSPICPRSQLRRIVSASGLDFRVGFELEFMILKKNETGKLISEYQGSWSYSRALDTGYARKIIEPALDALSIAGIEVEQYHAEAASSQYEVILAHKPPLEAVDNLLHAREILRAIAHEHDLTVTFHPKFSPNMCGSGSHVHLSVGQNGSGIADDEAFYAGILRNLPAILAFTYGSPASYLRMKDLYWAGGTVIAWGTQDREAALRKIEGSHWEMKTMDGLANPYLALAAVLAAGTRGHIGGYSLDLDDCTIPRATDGSDDRNPRKERKALPRTLSDSLKALEGSELAGVLNEELVAKYIAVKKAEVSIYAPMSMEKMNEFICQRY